MRQSRAQSAPIGGGADDQHAEDLLGDCGDGITDDAVIGIAVVDDHGPERGDEVADKMTRSLGRALAGRRRTRDLPMLRSPIAGPRPARLSPWPLREMSPSMVEVEPGILTGRT